MLLFKRQSESVDDRPEDFQKLRDTVEPLGFVYKLEEDIVYGSSNVRPKVQKFTINPM